MKQLLHEYAGVLAVRQARLVLGASLVSIVGDVMAMVALLLHLHDIGHGPTSVMALLICFAIPLVLTMGIAGSVADTHDPRRVLVGATTVQVVGAIGLVAAPSLAWTCLAVLVLQTGFAFATPVWTSVMPRIVGEDLAGTYVSLAQGMRAIASPLGAALAGVLVQQWGTSVVLPINTASFVVVLAALTLRVTRSTSANPSSSFLPRAALAALRTNSVVSALVFGVVPIILTVEAVNAVEVFLVRGELGATPAQFGLAEACGGVGALLGAFAAGAVRSRERRILGLLIGITLVPVVQIGQGLAPNLGVYAVAALAIGLALGVVNALVFALLLREIAEGDRGKVLALVSGLSRTATIGALAIGGVLGTQLGARTAYVVCGCVGLFIAATATLRVRAGVHRSVDVESTRRSVPRSTGPRHGERMTAISIRGLVKGYGDKRAVDGLDLDIETGEVFALLGPNGAGKTTTVEILEGFRTRDVGEVSVLGQDPESANRLWRNRIGIVLQSSAGLDLLTPREILGSTARTYATPRSVEEVIAAVGLEEKADLRIAGLSGGQRRRLDVGLGIVGRPELLFLDEPTTGFDPQARRDFWGLIRSLASEGTTILLTTHYLDEAEQLADRVGVIAAGKLLALDTPAKLGGRASEEATVSWTEAGQRRTLRTATPSLEVTRLAQRLGGEVPELAVSRPSLEDTYLSLIAPHVRADVTEEVMA